MNANVRSNNVLSNIIGFDRMFQMAEAALNAKAAEATYPPYNIIKLNDEQYLIQLAVAGFELSELSIETKERTVTITGSKPVDKDADSRYIFRGIGARSFKRQFQLAEFVEVKGASLKNGVLSIDLKIEIPEERKLRKIDISTRDDIAPLPSAAKASVTAEAEVVSEPA